jgi:beta-lactamase class A
MPQQVAATLTPLPVVAPTLIPAPTLVPAVTLIPAPTLVPAPTSVPAATLVPAPTLGPAGTLVPAPTLVSAPISGPAPTLVPAPTSVPAPTLAPAAAPSHVDARKRIEAAMQSLAPSGSAEVIAEGGALVATYHATQPRTAASTIKLPLLVEVLRQSELGTLDLSRRVTIRQRDVVGGTGDLQYQVGLTLTLQEVVQHMVLRSDNVAANILVDLVGMNSVNATAAANEFPNTFFRRSMLDTAAQAAGVENLTSAADLADMLDRIVRGTLISPTVSKQALSYLDERGRIDKNWLGLKLPSGAQLSHINGTLTGVRNDVGLITSPSGKSFVLALCQDHLSNDASGEAAIAELARQVLDILDAGSSAMESPL